MFFQLLALLPLVAAAPGTIKRSINIPRAAGTVTLSESMRVSGTFDCKGQRYGLGLNCDSGPDGGEDGAVFILANGATLKNCIIGPDQLEGVHCDGSCTIENVYWEAVCEDALTILQSGGTSRVIGGGAQGAVDKVIQHNGLGTVEIKDFEVDDFGKLYRSCGNCKNNKGPRKVVIDGVRASGGSVMAGMNANYGDVAKISNTCGAKTTKMCQRYEGCDKAKGDCESKKLGEGFDGKTCIDAGGNKDKC